MRDLHYALRRLRASPGFSVIAILTLALAIGANTTVFSMLNTLILRPLPVERAQELVFLSQRKSENQSFPNYRDFRDRTKTLSGLIAYRIAVVAFSHGRDNARVWGYEATGNYFNVVGVHPALGRFFTPAEDREIGGEPYVVLSYAAWQHRFGGDPNAVNSRVNINGLGYTILGVAPKGFIGTEAPVHTGVLGADVDGAADRAGQQLAGFASDVERLGNRAHKVRRLASRSAKRNPKYRGATSSRAPQGKRRYAGTLHDAGAHGRRMRGPVTAFASVIMAVAGLVLLIACSNLASFLLARATDRKKETAIRLALGAGRSRLLRQFLMESLLLGSWAARQGFSLPSGSRA